MDKIEGTIPAACGVFLVSESENTFKLAPIDGTSTTVNDNILEGSIFETTADPSYKYYTLAGKDNTLGFYQ